MGLNNYGLGFQVTADDKASQVFDKVGGKLGGMEKDGAAAAISLQEAAGEMKSMGEKFTRYGDAIIGGLLSAADNASAFAGNIAKAGAFTSATAADFAKLHDAAQNVDMAMKGFSFNEQAATLAQLANEIGNTDDAIAELIPSLTLAKITGMSGAAAAGFLSDAVAGFGLEAKDAQGMVDKMAFAMKKYGLTANELEGAIMPTIAASKLMGASFDDTLTMVGIANSGLGNIKKASMSATLALNQLADPKIQSEIAGIGVQVKDATGHFRPMIDILADVSDKTAKMTESQKAQALASVFGAKGAGGLNIVMDQLSKGVKNAAGELLTGAAAAAEMRRQMQGASGAADELANATMGTFGEQKKALKSTFDSLMTVVGEPVQKMLEPLVRGVVRIVGKITNAFKSMSPSFKKVVIGIVAAAGVFATFIGGLLAAGGAVAGLVLAGKALLIGLGVVAIAVLYLVAAMAPLILVGTALYMMWTRDIGGIATKVKGWIGMVTLAFEGLSQLFSDGGFSGSVREELNKAENSGIKAFAINVFLWFNRVKTFFVNLGTAFSTGMDRVAPVVERIVGLVQKIASHFQSSVAGAEENQSAFDKWGAIGAKVGDAIVDVVEFIAKGIENVLSVADGFLSTFKGFDPVLSAVKDAGLELWTALKSLFSVMSGPETGNQASTWKTVGEVLGWVATVGVYGAMVAWRILGGAISIVGGILGAIGAVFSGVINTITLGIDMVVAMFKGDWSLVWVLAKKIVTDWADTVIDVLAAVVGGIAGAIDAIGKIFGKDLGLKKGITDMAASLKTTGTPAGQTTAVAPAVPAVASAGNGATAGPAAAQAQGAAASSAAVAGAVAAAGGGKAAEVNVKTTLVVDGAVLADVVQKHGTQNAGRAFAPTPAPT